MVSRDEHDRCIGESLAEPLELPESEHDGVVGGPNGVKEISSDNYRVRPGGKDAVNGGAEGAGDIGFPLIDACRGLPVVLPDAQVGVCDVSQFHGWRMDPNALKSKNLRAAGQRDSGTVITTISNGRHNGRFLAEFTLSRAKGSG